MSAILQKHIPNKTVWAFGSRATRNAKRYSDLDLAIIGDASLSVSLLAALEDDFAESDLPFKVDLIDWTTISPEFRVIIKNSHVIVRSHQQ